MTQINNIYTTISECNFTCIYLCRICDSVQSQFDASLSSTFYKVCQTNLKKIVKCHLCVCVYAQNNFSKQLTTILFTVKIDIHYMYKQKVGSSINKDVSG